MTRPCHAIGIAGGAEKCRWLTDEAGFDAAIDYKSEDVQVRLKELCPKGIDIFFDNVGGDILDAALAPLAMRGRVVLCGGIANYNATELPPGPKNYLNLIVRRGRMEGFIVTDYMPRAAEAIGALAGWVQAGKLKYKVDVQHGLENTPATLRRLFEGRNEQAAPARRGISPYPQWGRRRRRSGPRPLKPSRARGRAFAGWPETR